jgi:hypothetical protein
MAMRAYQRRHNGLSAHIHDSGVFGLHISADSRDPVSFKQHICMLYWLTAITVNNTGKPEQHRSLLRMTKKRYCKRGYKKTGYSFHPVKFY